MKAGNTVQFVQQVTSDSNADVDHANSCETTPLRFVIPANSSVHQTVRLQVAVSLVRGSDQMFTTPTVR
jgi:hypothetical protein